MPHVDLNTDEFRSGLASDENYVLLDVRTPAEYAEGHIPGSINIDIHGNFHVEIESLDKEKTYYVNCRSGGRSGMACQIMSNAGFSGKLYNLAGGMLGWQDKGFEVEH